MLLIHGKPLARYLRELFEGKTRDRFGLSYRPPESEDDAARRDRLRQVRDLVVDAAEAVTRHLGEDEAKCWFELAFQRPAEGRRPAATVNETRLAAYDAVLARGVLKDRAARAAAEDVTPFDKDAESVARHIRGLVRARDEERARAAKASDEQDASDLLWLGRTEAFNGLAYGLLKPTDSDI